MRELILSPLFLTLFAVFSVLVGVLEASLVVTGIAAAVALAMLGWWGRRAWLKRRAGGWESPPFSSSPAPPPAARRWPRRLGTVALAVVAAYAEWVVLEVALHPWVDPPPGPVHGDASLHGVDYGKGLLWRPTVCRPATNPGVAAVALMAQGEPFPVAWVIGRPDGEIGAIDVQRYEGGPTTRFLPGECVRVHGRVAPVVALAAASSPPAGHPASAPGLAGFADAECDHRGNHLSLHVDFAACPAGLDGQTNK